MWRFLPILLILTVVNPIQAAGLLVPTEKKVPPLAMLEHHVRIKIEDQVAITKVEQTFRNHTDRQLEATYIFPVPKGASVQKFTMWVGEEEVHGELVEAKKARKIYEDIVRRTKDPGLLEYIDHNLLKVRVFPVPAQGDQKVSFQYVSVAPKDNQVIHYVYPLKTDGKAVETLKKFTIKVDLKSQHRLQNIYSPTHAITVARDNDRTAQVSFEKEQALLDRNFHLYFTAGSKDVGLTTLVHRPVEEVPGYAMLLISPRAELAKDQQVPRDIVFVMDTSGSMRGKRIEQAQKALKYCLTGLRKQDRFGVMHFSTTINDFSSKFLPAEPGQIKLACNWVDNLYASGGTAINDAFLAALNKRTSDKNRNFTVVFFTDGRPTVGEINTKRILKNVMDRNTGNTRIFVFGVGDDVNAAMLDQIAEKTRAVTTYVREREDIEEKVSSLYNKISHPVLANLKLAVGDGVQISEVYPPQLPDLFHGTQLVVLSRFTGEGHSVIKLTGNVGNTKQEFVYEFNFPKKTEVDKPFVEDLWARRKVGYLLDQIRINGESKELVDEVVTLSKRYGITTPYTSYLIVPDSPTPEVASAPTKPSVPDVAFRINPAKQPQPQPKKDSVNSKTEGSDKRTLLQSFDSPQPSDDSKGQLVSPIDKFGGGGGFTKIPPAQDPKTAWNNYGYVLPSSLPMGMPVAGTGGIQFAPVVTPGIPYAGPAPLFAAPGLGSRDKPKITSPTAGPAAPKTVEELARLVQTQGGVAFNRGNFQDNLYEEAKEANGKGKGDQSQGNKAGSKALAQQGQAKQILDQARTNIAKGKLREVQDGQLGVDLSIITNNLRNQSQITQTAQKRVQNRNCVEIGGIWIDDQFHPKMSTLTVKALSPAYFQLLKTHPEMKEVFQLGNHVVWVTPSGVALIIDTAVGRETLADREIDRLFQVMNRKS